MQAASIEKQTTADYMEGLTVHILAQLFLHTFLKQKET